MATVINSQFFISVSVYGMSAEHIISSLVMCIVKPILAHMLV